MYLAYTRKTISPVKTLVSTLHKAPVYTLIQFCMYSFMSSLLRKAEWKHLGHTCISQHCFSYNSIRQTQRLVKRKRGRR